MKKVLCLLTVVFGSVISIANAQWSTRVDEDLFNGKKATLIGDMQHGTALYFDCKQDAVPTLSFLIPEKDTSKEAKIPVELVLKVDENEVVKGAGVLQRRNEHYAEIDYHGNNIFEILKDIRDAQQKILAGFQIPGTDINDSFRGGVRGSTASVNKFIEACNLNLPK